MLKSFLGVLSDAQNAPVKLRVGILESNPYYICGDFSDTVSDLKTSIIIWLNWSRVKRSILIGSLSGPNFAIRTAKMDRSRSDFTDLCS